MRVPRLYSETPLAKNRQITLSERNSHYVSSVLRLRADAAVILFDGRGGEYPGRIESASRTQVLITLGEHVPTDRESPLHVTLAQGIVRGPRMDYCVQKATELGVAELVPLVTARSSVRLASTRAAKKIDHWRRVAVSACEQCGRTRVPIVHEPLTLDAWLAAAHTPATRLMPDPAADTPLAEAATGPTRVHLLIGPEGGLADDERRLALATGFTAVTLGPRILRAETAAIVALTLLQSTHGDLAGNTRRLG